MDSFDFLTHQQNELLKNFHQELMRFKYLLTNNQPEKEIERLITDGVLSGQAFFQKYTLTPSPIVDVGSGFGFPGIVFSILNPKIKFILVEPSEKRSEFLKHCVSFLHLENSVEVQKTSFKLMPEETFLFKAFSSLEKTLSLLQKYLHPKASSYHFKSLGYQDEWDKLSEKQKSGWEMNVFSEYQFENQKRFIVKINKKTL